MTRSTPSKIKPANSQAASFCYAFEAIGTTWRIEIFELVSAPVSRQLKKTIDARIAAFDKHYSRFRNDSFVAELAKTPGCHQLPDDAKPLFDLYANLYELTAGAVTPLIGQTLVDAGYDAHYSLQPKVTKLQSPPSWQEVITYDFPYLTMKRPALLDVGAAGKGYLVDLLGAILTDYGIRHFCIDGSGDLLYYGPGNTKLDVALEHPTEPQLAIGIAHLASHQSLCGSAGNRRSWAEYHHIIDPHKLASPRHIQAIWVIADTALVADGLTTALFFTPAAQLQTRYTFEYAIVRNDLSLDRSPNFPADFFTNTPQVAS